MLRPLTRILCWLVGSWLLAGPLAQAQRLEQQPDRVLSTIGLRDLSSDRVGFAWVAARQGMFRYDGRQLVPLNQLIRQGRPLHGEALRVVADAAGTVWLGMYDGLYAFVPATGELRQVPLPRLTGRHGHINAMLLYRGALWFGRGLDPCQVFRLSLRQPRQAPKLVWQHSQGLIMGIDPDSAGRLLLSSVERSWWLLPNGHVQPLADNSHRYRVQQANGARRAQMADHPLRLPYGPYYLTDSTLVEHRPPQPIRVLAQWPRVRYSAAVPHLDVLALDSTWYWLGDGQLLSLSIRRQRQPPKLLRTPLKLAKEWNGWLCFNRDRTGLWAFAEGMPGVVGLWPGQAPVQALPVAGGQRLSTRAINRLADGRLMVGSYAGTFTQAADSPLAPLRRWPDNVLPKGLPAHPRRLPHEMTGQVWFCSLRLPDARLLLGLENARNLWLLTGEQFEEITWTRPHPEPTGKTIFCLLRARTGQLWAGGQQGLFQLDLPHRTRRRYRENDPAWPLHRCEVEAMSEGANGELWLATNKGLYCLQPASGALRHYGPDEPPPFRLPTALLRCVLIPHPDSVWVGTLDAGLLLLHPRRGVQQQLTLGQGLPNEAVAFVLAPAPGRVLWVGTGNGLVRYEPRTGRRSDLTTSLGMATNELNRQSGWYDSARQRLYVGGVGGLSFLLPHNLTIARQPSRLLLTSLTQHHAQPDTIRTDYLTGNLPQGVELDPGDAFADLTLSLSSDIEPEQGRFTYRLQGTGTAPWQELGFNDHLRLQGLEPGDYTLEIRGETKLGLPTRNVLRVPVRARTYWWRQPGVWAGLTGLLVAVAVGGVYQWQQRRGRRREKQWQAEHALRQRIAADLHDDVGNLLTQVSMHSDLLRETPHTPEQTLARLDALAAASRQAARQMSDVVWSLDAGSLRLRQLLERMRDYAQEILTPAGLGVQFRVSPDLSDPVLDAALLHHFYLIYKEALHNVVKHAQATTVKIQLVAAAAGLTLTVADDGCGHSGHGRPGGRGLNNMQTRARAIGGTVRYEPLPTGFAVVVSVPLTE